MNFDLTAGPPGAPGPPGSLSVGALTQSSGQNPGASGSSVMMGLAVLVTPTVTGRVLFLIAGNAGNSNANNRVQVSLHTGTGAAPANGVGPTGTQRGSDRILAIAKAGGSVTFAIQAAVSGLTLGVPVWVDVHLQSPDGGTSTLTSVDVTAMEI